MSAAQATCFAIAIGRRIRASASPFCWCTASKVLALATYARQLRPGVGCRVQCHPHEYAQLRRHRASVADTVSFRAFRGILRQSCAARSEKGLNAFALVGYSMGGNLVLKLAGELGETGRTTSKPWLVFHRQWISPSRRMLCTTFQTGFTNGSFSSVCGGAFGVKQRCFRKSIPPPAWKESRPCANLTTGHRPLLRLFRRG